MDVVVISVWDAGTEVNTESSTDTAFLGQAAPNTGTAENGVVVLWCCGVVTLSTSNFIENGQILSDARFMNGDFTAADYTMVRITLTFDTDGEEDKEEEEDEEEDDDDDDEKPACFSEVATVQVEGKAGSVATPDLKVGDTVLTGNGDYQPIYAFAHLEVEAQGGNLLS
ncbi:MAG: hypothetical protein AAFO91_04495 [Bacteroidota bacterium]